MWLTKIEPVIGKVAVRDVDADHIRQIVHGPLRIDKDGRVIAGKGEAGNLYRLLKHMMRTAIRWKLRPPGADPTIEVDAPRVARRERLLADPEVTALILPRRRRRGRGHALADRWRDPHGPDDRLARR